MSRIRIEIDTSEQVLFPDLYELITRVVQADVVCRSKYNDEAAKATVGQWIYSRKPDPEQYTLKYRVEISS